MLLHCGQLLTLLFLAVGFNGLHVSSGIGQEENKIQGNGIAISRRLLQQDQQQRPSKSLQPPALPVAAAAAVPFSKTAPDSNSVLILGTTLSAAPPPKNSRDAAADLGFTPVVATADEWLSMSTADFKTYRALILGDPSCARSTDPLVPAENSISVWGPAITSPNIILIGTDPEWHNGLPGADTLTRNAISFAAFEPGKTGLYICFSCYYEGPSTPVKVLQYFGDFKLARAGRCFNNVKVVATHPALAGVTEASLSNWACSVHEVFTEKKNFRPGFMFKELAVADGVFDGVTRPPYILANGVVDITGGCSGTTADNCDFHFDGFAPSASPPTFTISPGKRDVRISPVIIDSTTGRKVRVLNSNRGFLYAPLPSGPFKVGELPHQFYLNGDKVAEQVINFPRTIPQYADKCVKLFVTQAFLFNKEHLAPGDGKSKYPEERRCVIFKTKA